MVTKIRDGHTWCWKAQLASNLAGVVAFVAAISTSTAAEIVTKEKLAAAIPRLEELANKAIANGQVPGLAIAVVYKDEVVYVGGFGVREAGRPEAVDANTVFQLASLSKPISSTIVAALVSNGTVSWDSRISDLDPGFQLHDPYPAQQVTVRDLFAHRSGLSGNAGNDLEGLGFSRDEFYLGYVTSSRLAAFVRATPIAISGLQRAQWLPRNQRGWRGKMWLMRNSISR